VELVAGLAGTKRLAALAPITASAEGAHNARKKVQAK
jgi:hypothetical protein